MGFTTGKTFGKYRSGDVYDFVMETENTDQHLVGLDHSYDYSEKFDNSLAKLLKHDESCVSVGLPLDILRKFFCFLKMKGAMTLGINH